MTRTYLPFRLAALGSLWLAALAAGPARAQTTFEQITDSPGPCGSFTPAIGGDGAVIAFESTCDLDSGSNADGSREIFRKTNTDPLQITDGEGCTSTSPVTNTNGSRIAFESDCNLTGSNADGNTEIFLWKSGGAGITQLTNSVACDNLSPTINTGATSLVAFDSNCNLTAGNPDGSSEIFRVTEAGAITQLTSDTTGDCDSINPSGNSAGDLYAYESDCNPAGSNPDFAIELFTVTSGQAIEQLTIAGDDACSSVSPAMDGAGDLVAFESDCDYDTGNNEDGSAEIFLVATDNGDVEQISDDDGDTACTSTLPQIAASGAAVAFSSFCNPTGDNDDGSLETYIAAEGSDPVQVTDATGCSSVAGAVGAAGTTVFLDSDCDHAGSNDDESREIYSAIPLIDCVCGQPVSSGNNPTATDALAVLRGAVGSGTCPACACDVDNSGGIFASDALRVLRKAVGQGVDLECPAQ